MVDTLDHAIDHGGTRQVFEVVRSTDDRDARRTSVLSYGRGNGPNNEVTQYFADTAGWI